MADFERQVAPRQTEHPLGVLAFLLRPDHFAVANDRVDPRKSRRGVQVEPRQDHRRDRLQEQRQQVPFAVGVEVDQDVDLALANQASDLEVIERGHVVNAVGPVRLVGFPRGIGALAERVPYVRGVAEQVDVKLAAIMMVDQSPYGLHVIGPVEEARHIAQSQPLVAGMHLPPCSLRRRCKLAPQTLGKCAAD
jgi:hypothetical protein